MKLAMIGLGRMGSNMAERLRNQGHEVVGFDTNPAVSDVASLADAIASLEAPRVVWIMLPSGEPTAETIATVGGMLEAGDVIVDGGNSYFRESIRRGEQLAVRGVHLVDCGTSGGIWGLAEGYCLMVGGVEEAVAVVEPVFHALATEGGYAHVGPPGAGHFVKMVHNGIEYGLLQAYGEGFEILERSKVYDLDLRAVAEVWRHGSVVRSWLLDLAVRALDDDPNLDKVAGYVHDSGEGRWTILEAIEEDVPAPITALALFSRFSSRQDDSYAMKMIAALRKQFGGHAVKEIEP